MTAELFINEHDAWLTYGVNMGEGFLDAIDAFLQMKDYIENDSRNEHGKRVVVAEPKVASRELTLHFTIQGESESDFRTKRASFESMLRNGRVNIRVPVLGAQTYKLLYLGKNVSYGLSQSRKFCTMSAKFEEPNPMDRAAETEGEGS